MNVIVAFEPSPHREPTAHRIGAGEVIAMPHIDLRTVQEMMRCFQRLEACGLLPPVAVNRKPID